ncbi:MAG: alkene reductase [Nitrospirota bacterium]
MEADLFGPCALGPYRLGNRMVMAPMTRNRAGLGLAPQEMNVLYYAQRASAGLIVTEAAQVSGQGIGYPNTPGIHTEEQVEGWRLVTDAVHAHGGLIFCQLFHGGRISHPSLQPGEELPVAPSAVKPEGEVMTYQGLKPFVTPRALQTGEVAGVVEQFRRGARCALRAGFDGVELHAANGYLPCQFLEDGANRRTDRYGGPVQNRVRFVLEVAEALVEVWGADRVGVHISPFNPFNSMHDSDPQALYTHLAGELNRLGLCYVSAVEIDPGSLRNHGAPNHVTRRVREIFEGAYITNGGYDREKGLAVLARGEADLVSYGRLFLANPDLPERFRTNAALNEPDPETFYGGDEHGYTDYPFLTPAA